MTELERRALLPAGLRDMLPPDAGFESALVERLIDTFAQSGFERVKPPLVEFEEGLLSSASGDLSGETFRLMDPVSQRMMGVRADITPQIARIAATRLRNEPRPLRLSYSGDVLRVRGTQLRPERQFTQVGAELIGSAAATADAEMILLPTFALRRLGLQELAVDLTIPPLVPALCAGLDLDADRRSALRRALDRKDIDAVGRLGGGVAGTLRALLDAAGPAERSFAEIEKLPLPPAAARERERVGAVIALLRAAPSKLELTLDPVENRGFEYHSGVSFTIFAPGVRGELGSGGRYLAYANGTDARASGETGTGEPATGFTLYVDTIMRSLPVPDAKKRVFLPVGTEPKREYTLRSDGWIALRGLESTTDDVAEARRMRCSHVLVGDDIQPVDGE